MNLDKMTNEELIVLAKESGDEYIKNYFFERNIKYAHYATRKFLKSYGTNKKQDYDDVFSAAQLALIKAYNSFDHSRGFKFVTYAGRIITNEINLLLREKRKDDKYKFISTSQPIYENNEGDTVYLEDMLNTDEVDTSEYIALKTFAEERRSRFTENEKNIYDLYFTADKSQSEVSEQLNCSQAYVSRKIKVIKRKLSA